MAEIRIDPLSGYRALVGEEDLQPDAQPPARDAQPDLFGGAAASGAHERIPHACAVTTLLELGADGLVATAETWRERMRAHTAAAARHLAIDETSGGDGHADLWALNFVPAPLARERERFTAHATRTMGGELLADLVQEEVRRNERIVAVDDEAVLLAPFGSRTPWQLLIAPRQGRKRWEDEGPTGAALLHDALRRLAARHGGPVPLSVWIRTAPSGAERFSWRIDIVPALAAPTALGTGAGIPVVGITPEQAAAELREQ
jgi:UDPglucose--hexose-1-phosphate uridylyltransferase